MERVVSGSTSPGPPLGGRAASFSDLPVGSANGRKSLSEKSVMTYRDLATVGGSGAAG
jgi:hypothetical protein